MVHLVVHLAYEEKIVGPVQYRWMYFVERYLHKMKLHVRNKAKLEGSIAEAYIVDECLTFCSRYLVGVETIFNQRPRNDDEISDNNCNAELPIFRKVGRPLGKGEIQLLSEDMKHKVHLYILNNREEVWPYAEKYKSSLSYANLRELRNRYNSEFPKWFNEHVSELNERGVVSKDLFNLACSPYSRYNKYSGHVVNGFRFHTLSRQMNRKSQNSGILSRGDDNYIDKEYYGILSDVWEIQYSGSNCIYLFNCEWFDVRNKGNGYTLENYSITSVKVNARLKTNEPFILANQVE